MIKEQIKQKAAEKLQQKYVMRFSNDPIWAWDEIRKAAQSASIDGKKEMIKALANTKTVRLHLRSLAVAEAESLLADNSLNLDELNRIFG